MCLDYGFIENIHILFEVRNEKLVSRGPRLNEHLFMFKEHVYSSWTFHVFHRMTYQETPYMITYVNSSFSGHDIQIVIEPSPFIQNCELVLKAEGGGWWCQEILVQIKCFQPKSYNSLVHTQNTIVCYIFIKKASIYSCILVIFYC